MSALAPALDRLDRIPLSAAQKKRLQIHPASILILLLAFAAWVIALGCAPAGRGAQWRGARRFFWLWLLHPQAG